MEFRQTELAVTAALGAPTSPALLQRELRFHYSQQFFAEAKGEEVIEDILQKTYSKKQSIILNAQLKDELEHLRLYRQIMNGCGADEQAMVYGDQFCQLVKSQNTLAEKVFVFQILAESVSAGYCEWRLESIQGDKPNAADHVVAADEHRHLGMGHCFLSLCDPDEVDIHLTKSRKTELIRQMTRICRQSLTQSFVQAMGIESQVDASRFGRTRLDRMMVAILLKEARKTGAAVSYEDIVDYYDKPQERNFHDTLAYHVPWDDRHPLQ